MTEQQALAFARRMAPYYRTDFPRSGTELAQNNDLLPLLNIPGKEDVSPSRLWPDRGVDAGSRLKIPIGVNTETGLPVWLDLKESAHGGMGPHGLCIGATGSGNPEYGFGVRWPHGNYHNAARSNLRSYFA
ncbi:hypothetical protein [Corynebacterium oculi]|uniref:hypothetical protein n=1 Tax=Corynebacterium oculi TaxID=1544416 RepID=UPI001B801BBE|nr:hypothetical protein [Corynebacterium oculi]